MKSKIEDELDKELKKPIGKYANWECNKCGIKEEHQVSAFTTINNELMPTCGWACRKCGMRGRMIFQGALEK